MEQRLASSDRGTKRTDPETGKKFYDLNADPIVSPYTGKSYPRSYFEQVAATPSRASRAQVFEDDEETEEAEVEKPEVEEEEEAAGPEIISLEDADAETEDETAEEEIPDVEDVEDVEDIGEDDEDVFLEEEDEESDDLDFDVGGGTDER